MKAGNTASHASASRSRCFRRNASSPNAHRHPERSRATRSRTVDTATPSFDSAALRSRRPALTIYFEMAEKAELIVDGRKLPVSNLNKVLWPKAGFTKGQMI